MPFVKSRLPSQMLQSVLVIAVVLSFWSRNCEAQKIPIVVEVDVSSSINRSGGPIPLTVHIHYLGSKAGLAGNLRFNLVTTTGTLMATYQFDGLYLPRGEQTYQFLLQPPTSGVWEDAFDFYPIFQTDAGQQYRLPEQLLRLPGASRRSCVISVATESDEVMRPRDKQIAADLAFETRMPGYDDVRPTSRSAVTLFRPLSVQNFPTQPLEHCVSDVVLLPGGSFSRLSQRQCAALLAWVKAGGSVAVFLDESGRLSGSRMEFLNELLNSPQDSPLVYQLSSGKLQFAEDINATILFRNQGLGRVALAASPQGKSLAQSLGEKKFRSLYIHLWKVRKEQQAEILASENGEWSFAPGRRYTVKNNYNFDTVDDAGLDTFVRRFRPLPTGGGNGLLEHTLPEGMEMLPLWLIGVTLFFYILVIGPGDYLLLGALGLRKYTWIFFPVVTVLFTAGAIVTANYKMQGNNDGGKVLIRDISAKGDIVRENEISTYVPISGGENLVTAKRELLTPVSPQRLGANTQYANSGVTQLIDEPPVFRGRFPIEAQLVQQVHKWTPEMVRRVRIPIEPTKETSGFDWTAKFNPLSSDDRIQLASRLQATFGSSVSAKILHHSGESFTSLFVCGNQFIFFSENDTQMRQVVGINGGMSYQQVNGQPDNFLATSALREEAGMYSVVSQLSPKCDDFLEDLPILDPTDESTFLLLVTVRKGNHWEIYRKLIRSR